ncbi:MAG: PadR family transcriptional regulator [Pseudoflavonifractor sp.]
MKSDKTLLSGSTTLLVLALLADGDRYGYEMIAALEAKSNHTFALKEGTLYPILHTLEKDGGVTAYNKTAPTGRTRKYYHITERGTALLAEKKQEWQRFSQAVTAIAFAPA